MLAAGERAGRWVGVPVTGGQRLRPVTPRARRMAPNVASEPPVAKRTSSADGTISVVDVASGTVKSTFTAGTGIETLADF